MKTRTSKFSSLLAFAGALGTVAVIGSIVGISILAGTTLLADDRDILRESTTKPYLFVILDTSGSMNWAPKCTAAQVTAGTCTYHCETGDCAVPRDADDPASKFRQAKEALYEVLSTVEDIDLGFATYNSDDLRATNKHWLYEVKAGETQIALQSGALYPEIGSDEVFGLAIGCDRGGGDDAEMGCYATSDRAADTTDLWEMTKVRRLPKFGENPTSSTAAVSFYIRNSSQVYYVTYTGALQPYDSEILVHVRVDRCTGSPANDPSNGCNDSGERTIQGQRDIRYTLVGDFIGWDFGVRRVPVVGSAGDGFTGATFSNSANACAGLDPNSDTGADDYGGVNLKQITGPPDNLPAYFNPPGTTDDWRFQYGDFIPLNWTLSNKDELLKRLAPRLNGGDPAIDPEAFATATYLQDRPVGGVLPLKNLTYKPLVASGSTPLGASLVSFRNWYKGCTSSTSACNGITGWDDFAASNDSSWGCRRKYVLVLTDGDETCGGNPCAMTDILDDSDGNGDGVSTFVVGFGVQAGANVLTCMAANGGTGQPILPQNKQELIDALTGLLSQIREEASAFASAAVPQVQANATDKIFLSNFTPMGDEGFWAGRMDAFLKPLPLDANGRPDRTELCDADTLAGCFLWDAGDVQEGLRSGAGTYNPRGLLLQAPHPDDVDTAPPFDPAELMLGTGADERRVVYTQWNEPGNRKLFTYPATNSQKYDLWTGMGIGYIVGNTASETAADERANAIITEVLLEKEGTIQVPDPGNPGNTIDTDVTYLLGDIFHADPVVLNRPSNFTYYTSDPYPAARLCAADPDPDRGGLISYRAFADRNVCRRTLLLTASNDGQLHAFDAGIFRDPASGTAECLLPAKDLDGDGTAEVDEFTDGLLDYDTGDDIESDTAHVLDGAYDNGSGREVFSFIPRAMLETQLTFVEEQDRNKGPWGVDGSPRIDDVFIDPQASEAGTTTCVDREWRSVLVGGYREGGPGYYALDITQPDTLDNTNVPQPAAGYTPSCFDGGVDCGNVPYPSVLWEFQDLQSVQVGPGILATLELDEDLNNERDLGDSWSKAATGRIRVCTGACTPDEAEDRFVAVFGGGLAEDPIFPRGNFIYMVDIETGKLIYKKRVIGSVPADIATVDSNGDTYIDRLYFGTTAGFIYKVQLEASIAAPMRLVNQTFQTRSAGVNYNFTAERLSGPVGDLRRYDPFQVFSTGGRPIYQEISTIYVAQRNRVALAVGTGNRWNLWHDDGVTGRFYVLLDNDANLLANPTGAFVDSDRDGVLNITCSGCTQPLTESKYQAIAPDDPNDPNGPFLLYNGNGTGSLPGWYLTLEGDEKVITEAFSFGGITIFTSFQPTEVANDDGTCSRAGRSHVFILGTVTALGYYLPDGSLANRQRYLEVTQFSTPPFVEQSATKNPEDGGGGPNADDVTDELAAITEELKKLQSTRCRYANYTMNVKTILADTAVIFVAPVPVCIDPTSWKEF
jgi:hypothetical protein